MAPRRPQDGKAAGAGASIRAAQPYIDASWQFIGAIALCTLGGWFADRKLGTTPWLLVVGAFLGMAAGTVTLVRVVTRLNALDKANRAKEAQDVKPYDESR